MPDPVPAATFRDHFSGGSANYAAFRPRYPDALFDTLAGLAPGRQLAWDCGTGSGQAALGLVRHFERVIASDASAQQLAAATRHERVSYVRATAEASSLPDASVALVTAAQAAHWFDVERFQAEVRRVLVPRGVIAIWGYGSALIEPAIDEVLRHFYSVIVGPYWPPERQLVDARYASLPFPFEELALPAFAIERDLLLAELSGYLRTWSATRRYIAEHDRDPVEALEQELAGLWGNSRERRRAVWPLFIRAGRV